MQTTRSRPHSVSRHGAFFWYEVGQVYGGKGPSIFPPRICILPFLNSVDCVCLPFLLCVLSIHRPGNASRALLRGAGAFVPFDETRGRHPVLEVLGGPPGNDVWPGGALGSLALVSFVVGAQLTFDRRPRIQQLVCGVCDAHRASGPFQCSQQACGRSSLSRHGQRIDLFLCDRLCRLEKCGDLGLVVGRIFTHAFGDLDLLRVPGPQRVHEGLDLLGAKHRRAGIVH